MSEKGGWYVIQLLHGPISDAELLQLAKTGRIGLSSIVTHETKTKGRLIRAENIRDIRVMLESAEAPTLATSVRYEFKGDVLGETTFQQYERKYHRKCSGHNEPAPQRSDQMDVSALASVHAEKWFTASNVITARIAFPFESIREPFDDTCWFGMAGNIVTVADVRLRDLVHKFIDGLLFQIVGFFDSSGFQRVHDAFATKYGAPTESTTETCHDAFGARQQGDKHVWSNPCGAIVLNEVAGDRETSQFVFLDRELTDKFNARKPAPSTRDL